MTKLEEAALIHMKSKLGNDDYNLSGDADLLNLFIDGAEWLLEQAKQKEYVVKSIDSAGEPCDIDGLTRISYLEKLCKDK